MMTRWAPDAAGRLHNAALELFLEQGFAATTVPQIAERAGLTTRSFFRHFADKREVLFTGEDELPAVVTRMYEDADPSLGPMEAFLEGFRSIVIPRLLDYRKELLVRRQIVRSDDGLRERELRKLAILHEAATEALTRRGLTALESEIAGRLAVAIYDTTLEIWLTGEGHEPLEDILTDVHHTMGRMVAPVHL